VASGVKLPPDEQERPLAEGRSPKSEVRWHWLGRAGYRRVLADQLAARERVWAGEPGVVYLCEHPPVITLGRSADRANVLAAGDVPVIPIERGGDVTYHGPGQLVVYPIVRVIAAHDRSIASGAGEAGVRVRGVVDFLARVAGAIADACAALGAPGAAFRREPAGVWLDDRKLAACGIHLARGVSVHGFALDVATPPEAWRPIRPCGRELPQISLAAALAARGQPAATVERVAIEVGPRVARALA
jgi:lipoate-protein ligase B